MYDLLSRLGEKIPELVSIIFMVIYFIRSLQKSNSTFLDHMDKKDAKVESMTVKMTESLERYTDKMSEAIERNTDKMNAAIEHNTDKMNRALEHNTEVLTHVKIVLGKKMQDGK